MRPPASAAGHLAHEHGAGPKLSSHEAEPVERLRLGEEPVGVDRIEIDDLRDEQQLARDPGRRALALQALVDEALVGGVLVDDDDAVLRLRDDVGAVDLRPRGAERAPRARLGLPEEGAQRRPRA